MGIPSDSILWDWCIGKTMQLIHADGLRSGARFIWKNYFEPAPELLAEFERLSNQPLDDL